MSDLPLKSEKMNLPTVDRWKELLGIVRLRDRMRKSEFWAILLIIGAVILLFHKVGVSVSHYRFGTSLFTWLWEVWSDPVFDASHGPWVPVFSLGLLWWKRKEILKIPARQQSGGLWVIGFALLLHWVGMRGQIPRASVLALILLLWGLVVFTQGWSRGWAMIFPLLFLGFMIPMNFLESIVAFPMRLYVTHATTQISHILGIAVMRSGTVLFSPTGAYQYDVAPACSGIRSLTSMVMLSLLYGYIFQDRVWKKILLFVASFPLAIAGNIVRLVLIIVVAECFGQKAGNYTHEISGFLVFAVILILLLLISKLINLDYSKTGRFISNWFAQRQLKEDVSTMDTKDSEKS